jgi:hypothetical protein
MVDAYPPHLVDASTAHMVDASTPHRVTFAEKPRSYANPEFSGATTGTFSNSPIARRTRKVNERADCESSISCGICGDRRSLFICFDFFHHKFKSVLCCLATFVSPAIFAG